MARARTLEALTQDLRFGLRQLGRNAGWTAVATITLALGIGATTAIFSVIDSLILNPLPYRDADRVVNVMLSDPKSGISMSPAASVGRAWKERATTLEGLEMFAHAPGTIAGKGAAERVDIASVSASFIPFTGVPMRRGRSFTPEDQRTGAPKTAVLTEGTWRKRFGSDESIIGRTITIDDEMRTIIGVASSRLALPSFSLGPFDVIIPLDTANHSLPTMVVARIKDGVDRQRARAELVSLRIRSSRRAAAEAR